MKRVISLWALVLVQGVASADCVKPIYPGENLWKIVKRIGECLDESVEQVNSKLDVLACDSSACEVIISQSDIPYVITGPGIYCLSESVTNTGIHDFLITVSSSDVILDLKEHLMDGGTMGGCAQGAQDGIVVYPGVRNVTIKNGTIANCAAHGINANGSAQPDVQTPIECLTIDSINVIDMSEYLPALSNVDYFADRIGSVLDSISAVAGFDKVLECCLGNQFERVKKAVGIYVDCVNELVISNSKSCGVQGDGFFARYVQGGLIQDCQSERNGGNGFVFDNCDVSCVQSCKAEQNCLNGFYEVACNGDNSYKDCTAKQNGVHGFRIIGNGKTIDSCIANQNTLDGFFVVGPKNTTVDGSLDITFGGDGQVFTVYPNLSFLRRVAIQKDGKIVAAGIVDFNGAADITLARYNVDGSLDTSFGVTGTITTNFGGFEDVGGLGIQKDGKIVMGGGSDNSSVFDALIARYTIDGVLDSSFGTGGSVRTILGTNALVQGLALQKDNKIVVGAATDVTFALLRYNEDGSLDSTFNGTGIVTTDMTATSDITRDIFIQKDGKIVVVGQVNNAVQTGLARYNIDGSLDSSFGGGTGKVITDINAGVNEVMFSITEQKDGKIVIAGVTFTNIQDFMIARYNHDGTLDTSFNGTGSIILNLGGVDNAFKVLVQKDGKIIVAGYGGASTDVKIVRYRNDGTLDTSFGTSGIVTVNYGGTDRVFDGQFQADGKVIVVGRSNNNFALSRYNIFKRCSTLHDSVAQENGRHGFNIIDAAKMMLFNNVASNNGCNGFMGPLPSDSAIDTITKNIADNNACANYSNIDSVLLSASAGAWKNIRLS